MVLKIRLARWGARNNPFYGIVLAQQRAARDGKHLERLGTYNPVPGPEGVKHVELNCERIKYWLGEGAQPTERVAWILAKASLMPPTPRHLHDAGVLDLTKPDTWHVRVADEKGQELALLSSQEFAEKFAAVPSLKKYIKPSAEPSRPLNKLDWQDIKLDGSQTPLAPLSKQDALVVLKSYLGI
ncbi:hypothetical protein HDU91_004069 [Kappamyces sp. JEL0680]|nr:hypothetical protein HDU91_004069 [Kappamyces sp. JEL0680]